MFVNKRKWEALVKRVAELEMLTEPLINPAFPHRKYPKTVPSTTEVRKMIERALTETGDEFLVPPVRTAINLIADRAGVAHDPYWMTSTKK